VRDSGGRRASWSTARGRLRRVGEHRARGARSCLSRHPRRWSVLGTARSSGCELCCAMRARGPRRERSSSRARGRSARPSIGMLVWSRCSSDPAPTPRFPTSPPGSRASG
jgi:hypothetical protein